MVYSKQTFDMFSDQKQVTSETFCYKLAGYGEEQ